MPIAQIRTVLSALVPALLCVSLAACSSSQSGANAVACFRAGFRFCPNDPPTTQVEADACDACAAKYQALTTCDPKAGFTCVDGKSDTRKDGVCGAEINAFETCFIHASQPADAATRD